MNDDQPIETGEADARPYTAPAVAAPDPRSRVLHADEHPAEQSWTPLRPAPAAEPGDLAAAPPDPVVCILATPDDWGPLWIFVHPDENKPVGLVLIDGAPAYPVHGLLASVRVHASGATSPADLSAFGGDHDRRGH